MSGKTGSSSRRGMGGDAGAAVIPPRGGGRARVETQCPPGPRTGEETARNHTLAYHLCRPFFFFIKPPPPPTSPLSPPTPPSPYQRRKPNPPPPHNTKKATHLGAGEAGPRGRGGNEFPRDSALPPGGVKPPPPLNPPGPAGS